MSTRTVTTTITSDASGDGTGFIQALSHADLDSLEIDRTGAAATTTVTVTNADTGQPVLTLAGAQTLNTYSPRLQASDPADGSAVAGLIGGKFNFNRLKIVVGVAGDTAPVIVKATFQEPRLGGD